jgi:hypothetical protein
LRSQKKKAPTDHPPRKPVRAKKKEWIGYVHHKHTLPAEHLTIECRMVEQKKPPATSGMWLLGVSLLKGHQVARLMPGQHLKDLAD